MPRAGSCGGFSVRPELAVPIGLASGSFTVTVDVLVTWIGAAVVLRYFWTLTKRREQSPIERRTRFLLGVLGLMLFLRGFVWLLPETRWLAVLSLVPATLLPLAMTVFVEGLLRRHVPAWAKLLSVTATAVAFGANLMRGFTRPQTPWHLSAILLGSLLVTMLALTGILALRDRTSLSRAENSLVRACLLLALVSLPLVATDFHFESWSPVRVGTLGPLLLCYTLLGRQHENERMRWGRDVGRLVVRAALACGVVVIALPTPSAQVLIPVFALGVTLVVGFAVLDRLRDAETTTRETQLLTWLAREPAHSLRQFARELRHLPLTADALLLHENDLAPYDGLALARALDGRFPVQSLGRLRARGAGERPIADSREARGVDELIDLLERNGMTHVGLLDESPLRLLLVHVPELPGAREAERALAAVLRRGQHAIILERAGTPGAHVIDTPAASHAGHAARE
jgi:hypothetical protein